MSNFKRVLFASGAGASMMIAMSLSMPSFAQEAGDCQGRSKIRPRGGVKVYQYGHA